MVTVEIGEDEIVDAIIANPALILRAIERLKENADSLAAHHRRWVGIAATISDPHRTAGRAAGGIARAAALSPERRREIAQQAARARWGSAALSKAHHTEG
jgi:hypothetical protein